MRSASREWSSSSRVLVVVALLAALLAHLLLFCRGEYSSRNDVCARSKITAASHRQASLLTRMKKMVDGEWQ